MNSSIFAAVRWNAASTLVRYAANFLQIIIIARVLGPEKFATVSIILAIITSARPLLDLGSGIAVIHYQQLHKTEISTIYWLNLIFSTAIAIATISLFPVIASFYSTASLSLELFILVALHLILFGSGQLYSALAEKELQFKKLAFIEITSAVIGVVAAVLYLNKIGPDAIVIGVSLLCSSFVRTLLLHFILNAGTSWYPFLQWSAGKKFLKFGATSTVANTVNTVYANADLFLGARFLSATTFGLYSLPRDIGLKFANAIINPIITRVALPVIASKQDDPASSKRAYHLTVLLTCSISFPVYFLLILYADEFIALLLNEEWSDSSKLLKLIALWGLIRAAYNPIGALCFASGRPEKLLHWHLLMFIPTFIILGAALQYGVEGLVVGNIGLAVASLVLSWVFIAKPIIQSELPDLLDCFGRPMLCGLISFFIASLFLSYAASFSYFLAIALSLLAFVVIYLLFSKLINNTFFEALKQLLYFRPTQQHEQN